MGKMKHRRNLGVPKLSYAERLKIEAEETTRKKKQWTHNVYMFTQQETIDLVGIALHDAFGFGPERLKRFQKEFEAAFHEIMQRTREDMDIGDEDRWYSTAKLEEALRAAWGDNYTPRAERYELDYALESPDMPVIDQ